MSFRLVCGRAGSGKSKFCFKEVASLLRENSKIYIITPEQFSYTAEKKLMEAVYGKAVLNAEVLTFNRMAYRVINEVGGGNKINLSPSGKAMLMYHILSNRKSKLKFLGKSDENSEMMEKMITELKKHRVDTSMLLEKIEEVENPYLKAKLEDISLIYQDFEEMMGKEYIDENDTLTVLAEEIERFWLI